MNISAGLLVLVEHDVDRFMTPESHDLAGPSNHWFVQGSIIPRAASQQLWIISLITLLEHSMVAVGSAMRVWTTGPQAPDLP